MYIYIYIGLTRGFEFDPNPTLGDARTLQF